MNLTKKLLPCLFSLILIPSLALAQNADPQDPPPFDAEAKVKILDGIKNILSQRAFVPNLDFSKWDALVEKHQPNFDRANTEQAFASAVTRAIREFGISHVGLRTPRSATTRRTGQTAGLGVTTKQVEEGLLIENIRAGSAFLNAGIKVGDTITEINGSKPSNTNRLPNSLNTPLSVRVVTPEGKSRVVPIVVKTVSTARKNTLNWPNENTAILKLTSFTRGYNREELEGLVKEAAKADMLLIDLRNNGGGAVNNLSHFLGLFLPEESEVGVFVNKRTYNDYLEEKSIESATLADVAAWSPRKFRARKPAIEPFKGKIAVLVNRGSASASEIFCSALKEVGGATIVGANTRGAVLASTYGRLPNGFELQYPVSDYVTIKGIRLEGNPWKPDVEVTQNQTEDGKDAFVEAAIQALTKTNPY